MNAKLWLTLFVMVLIPLNLMLFNGAGEHNIAPIISDSAPVEIPVINGKTIFLYPTFSSENAIVIIF